MLLITLLINMFFIKSYRYNNPLVIISAISLFLCFLNLNIGSVRKINLLSSTVVAVYLIHEHPFVRPFLAGNIRQIHDNFCGITEVCIFLLIAVGLILISFIIERVRLLLMNPLLDFVFYKIGKYKNNKR